MKTRNIFRHIILISSMVISSAQANNIHPDEFFSLINSGDSNQAEAIESNSGGHNVQAGLIHPDEIFRLVNSDYSHKTRAADTVEFSKMELSDTVQGNEYRREQSIINFIPYLTTY